MREINECTAEVFRRSEKRIKERKRNRKRTLVCCIPLLVCLTVFSAAMMPTGNEDNAVEDMGIPDCANVVDSIICSYVQVEIQEAGKKPEHYEMVTEKLDVEQMYNVILDAFDEAQSEEISSSETEEANDVSASKTSGYVFTFSTAEGNSTVYALSGNKLVNEGSGQTVILSDEQLSKFKEAFHLPD